MSSDSITALPPGDPLDQDDPRLVVSVAHVAAALTLSRQSVYRLLDKGLLDSRYIEGRRVVPVHALREYVQNLPSERAS